jgi:hypothetical protein
MPSHNAPAPPPPAFEPVDAVYEESPVPAYRGNPLIEALPPILSPQEAARLLAHYPAYDPANAKLPGEIRMHLVQDALRLFIPLPEHLQLEAALSRTIRDGYRARNPIEKQHWQQLDRSVNAILRAGGLPLRGATPSGFGIIGMPGIGKSYGAVRNLQLYPQVICHRSYRGQAFSRLQVVWLLLTCPPDGSIKGLCYSFFRAIDDLLGTDYYERHAEGRHRTVDQMMPAMARVAALHSLGLLVVDEIQHLRQAPGGGAAMLNFFLALMNVMSLPVVLVGTHSAHALLSREFRQIRRLCGQGDFILERLPNDKTWEFFAESMWKFQFLRTAVPFSVELADVLHDATQGVHDFAIKVFMLTQCRAIATGVEKITANVIRSVSRDSLKLAGPVLQALRTGQRMDVAHMEDLDKIDFPSALQAIQRSSLLTTIATSLPAMQVINEAAIQPAVPLPPADRCSPPDTALSKIPPRRSRKEAEKPRPVPELVQLAEQAKAGGKSVHTELVHAGIIKPIFEFKGTHTAA